MSYDVTFIITQISKGMVSVETYNKNFRYLNCEISEKDLVKKMNELTNVLNNAFDGCHGCLFCTG